VTVFLNLGTSGTVFDALSATKASVYNIKPATFKNASHKNLHTCHVTYWESHLESLTIQNKIFGHSFFRAAMSFYGGG